MSERPFQLGEQFSARESIRSVWVERDDGKKYVDHEKAKELKEKYVYQRENLAFVQSMMTKILIRDPRAPVTELENILDLYRDDLALSAEQEAISREILNNFEKRQKLLDDYETRLSPQELVQLFSGTAGADCDMKRGPVN